MVGGTITRNVPLNLIKSFHVSPQADYTMCLWLIIVDMRQTKSIRVMNRALKIVYLNDVSV